MFLPRSARLRRLLRVATAATFSVCALFATATESSASGKQAFSTVVIDAGHGGHDRGAVRPIAGFEKELTLDVARRLEKELKRSGLRTVMTRTDDSFVSLGKRSMTANLQKDAVFVSIHFNVGSRLGARGFESFYRSSESAGLAHAMQRAMLETIPTENRGVKRRGFYVLRHTEIPAVLLECGFMSNADEARIIRTPEFRQKLAEKLAAALVQSARMGDRT